MTLAPQLGLSHGLSGVQIETYPEMLSDSCDALVLVTEWQEFLCLDFAKMRSVIHHNVIIDGRNFLDKEKLQHCGFRYVGIGRN